MPYRVENIVRKGEIACYNVFHSFKSLVRQNEALCGNGLKRCGLADLYYGPIVGLNIYILEPFGRLLFFMG